MIDCIGPSLSPVYEKVNQKEKYVKFNIKINIFTINKVQNKNFAQCQQNFQDGSDKYPLLSIHILHASPNKSYIEPNIIFFWVIVSEFLYRLKFQVTCTHKSMPNCFIHEPECC